MSEERRVGKSEQPSAPQHEPQAQGVSADRDAPGSPPAKSIRFHYLKSPAFHTLHADGVIGGLTPRGDVHVAFYAERLPIPTETQHAINADGSLGSELREFRSAREGIVREMVVDVVMDIAAAEALHGWLKVQIDIFQQRFGEVIARAQEAAASKEKA